MTVAADLAEAVGRMLEQRPAGLFVDIDGTLARIMPNPRAVTITPAVRQALDAFSRKMTVVALTGRDVAAAHAIVGLDAIIYAGNHGLEWREQGETTLLPEARRYVRQAHEVSELATRGLRGLDGLVLEDKGPTLSFHYRAAPDPAHARDVVDAFLRGLPEARGLERRQGKMVIELRPPIAASKGTALEHVVDQRGLRAVVTMGDDTTDVDSFRALRRLRDEQRVAGLCVVVLGTDVPPELIEAADYQLPDTDAVEVLLVWLAARVEGWSQG